jgi:protein subunit release factor A
MKKNNGKRELLFSVTAKDCKFEYMTNSKGAGGQKRDKTASACRCTHPPSGAVGFCQENRQQSKNKSEAFVKMVKTPEFKLWQRLRVADMAGKKTVDQLVEEAMAPENIKVEIKEKGGKWTEETE